MRLNKSQICTEKVLDVSALLDLCQQGFRMGNVTGEDGASPPEIHSVPYLNFLISSTVNNFSMYNNNICKAAIVFQHKWVTPEMLFRQNGYKVKQKQD